MEQPIEVCRPGAKSDLIADELIASWVQDNGFVFGTHSEVNADDTLVHESLLLK
jgi:hypothetical protein